VPSDRSLGGQTLGGATLNTVTRTAFDTVGVGAPPDALGSPLGGPVTPATTEPERSFGDFGDFGALAEPPSMLSLPSASFPSFPSLTGARASEPEPFDPNAFGDLGDLSLASTPSATYDSRATVSSPSPAPSSDEGGFGEIRDLSIVSSPGLPSPVTLPRRGAPGPQASRPGSRIPTPASSEGNFGQIRDLSIVSTSAETQGIDAITEARNQALAGGTFGDGDLAETDENTAAMQRGPGGTIDILPFENPAAGGAGANLAARGEARIDDGADLPAAVATADLPAVARGKAPPTRKAGQLGMGPSGGAAMAGSPPPLMAPQPFGPMERAPDEDDLPSFTAAMPAPAPARPPVPSGRPNAPNAPNAARAAPTQASPVAPPMPAGAAARSRPPPAPPAPPPPFAATLASPARTGAPGGSAPPGPPVTAPMPAQQAQTPRGPGPAPMQPAYMQNTLPAQQAYTGPQGQPGQPGHPGHSAPPAPFLPAPSAAVNAYGASASGPYASPVTHPAGPPGGQPPIAPGSPFGPPPGQSGSGPYASRPPGPPAPTFGVHPSSLPGSPPPAPHAVGVAPPYPSMAPGPGAAPPPPRNIGFAAPVLVDVTPRALVVETAGGYTDTIIPRNAKIPCERTRRFATGRDGQTSVRVRVGQGEHGHFPQNTYLGEVELSGLRPAPRGEVTVAVTFEVDADGTLRIRARDVQTGQEARATLHLQGVADESSVVMMINRFAQQPVTGNGPTGPAS
jgi:molecular chaperone DnaK